MGMVIFLLYLSSQHPYILMLFKASYDTWFVTTVIDRGERGEAGVLRSKTWRGIVLYGACAWV